MDFVDKSLERLALMDDDRDGGRTGVEPESMDSMDQKNQVSTRDS